VDERAVRRAEILDRNDAVFQRDSRVSARNHLLDEHHVELAGATDHDLLAFDQGILASLILAGDEAQREARPARPGVRQGLLAGDFTRHTWESLKGRRPPRRRTTSLA